jgi:hypothetical protein
MRSRFLLALAVGCSVVPLGGCGDRADALPPEPVLQPVVGKVTVRGKPLAQAVVTFLQEDERGTLAVGETDEDGFYRLEHMGRPGAAAADYRIGISYLVGTDGTVYGLAPRSGLAKPYGMLSAKELIVPEWSDLGQATHRATVPPSGGTLDFDIEEPLLPPPAPEASADPAPDDESASAPTDPPASEQSPATPPAESPP